MTHFYGSIIELYIVANLQFIVVFNWNTLPQRNDVHFLFIHIYASLSFIVRMCVHEFDELRADYIITLNNLLYKYNLMTSEKKTKRENHLNEFKLIT